VLFWEIIQKAISGTLSPGTCLFSITSTGSYLEPSISEPNWEIIDRIRKTAAGEQFSTSAVGQGHTRKPLRVDGMKVNIDGKLDWLWDLMDADTRFWISNMISQRIDVEDAQIYTPSQNEWKMIPLIEKMYNGTLSFSDLLAQHNENRILFPRVVMLSIGSITRYNTIAEMFFWLPAFP